jgi:hypothetical protein
MLVFVVMEKRPINRIVPIGVLLAQSNRDARIQASHKWPGRVLIKPRRWESVKTKARIFALYTEK